MIVPLILVMNDDYFLPYSLSSIGPFFDRFVIYNVGSTDNTWNVIDWFIESNKPRATFFVRDLPFVDPHIQGVFRNSMIAEARSENYFLVDGDEIYNPQDIQNILKREPSELKPYGVVRRIEVGEDLKSKYNIVRSHHRTYHRTAIWVGKHPGEEAYIAQTRDTEFWIEDTYCYHFHHAIRSSDSKFEVPKRKERRDKATYCPGALEPFDLLKELPILQKPINNFPVNPDLERLQRQWA